MSNVLVVADATWVIDEVRAAIEGRGTAVEVARRGQHVLPAVRASMPDVVVADLQIANMGAMAISLELRHERDAGRLPHVPIVLLLDRLADIYLARRSMVDGWALKPLNALTLRRTVAAAATGDGRFEGIDESEWPALRAAARGEEAPVAPVMGDPAMDVIDEGADGTNPAADPGDGNGVEAEAADFEPDATAPSGTPAGTGG